MADIWLPPEKRERHVVPCTICGDYANFFDPDPRRRVVWWQVGEDMDEVYPLCPPCFVTRRDEWWAEEKRRRAERMIEKYAARGDTGQIELDVKAVMHGVEKLPKKTF